MTGATAGDSPVVRAPRAARLIDVARRAGVSRQTVSNAVNSPHLVRPETLSRVQAAIADLDYQPNLFAREMRLSAFGRTAGEAAGVAEAPAAGSAGAIAVHLRAASGARDGHRDDRPSRHGAIAVAGVAAGRPVLTLPALDPVAEADLLHGWHRLVGLAGIVLDGADPSATDPRLAWARDNGVAAVVLDDTGGADDTRWAAVPAVVEVTEDAGAGLRLAHDALVRAGHARIVHLALATSTTAVPDGSERSDLPDADVATVRRAVGRLLARDLRPTALVCDRPAVTLAAVTEIRAWGLTVGEDVAVVGLGDTPALAALDVAAVEVPDTDVAAACVAAVLSPPRHDAPLVRRRHALAPVLVHRASLAER